MFITGKEKEYRDQLRAYIDSILITEEILAEEIGINAITLIRFLKEEPIRKTTLLKIGQFLSKRTNSS